MKLQDIFFISWNSTYDRVAMRCSTSVRLVVRSLFVIEEIRMRVMRELLKVDVDVDESFGILRVRCELLR